MKDRYGQHVFDFRSHHHPSNPWLYSAFYNLDLNLVQAYRVVTQSVCLKLEAGSLRETEVARSELTFHVR